MQTSEAERIGVNQVAKILPSGKSSGSDQREAPALPTATLAGMRALVLQLRTQACTPPKHRRGIVGRHSGSAKVQRLMQWALLSVTATYRKWLPFWLAFETCEWLIRLK